MATRGRLVFDGDNLYTEKEARIYKLTDEIESSIDSIPGVVDDLSSDSTTDALSANMGRVLQNQIDSLTGVGIFLSGWDCTTGLPDTEPQEDPYTYVAGNYYIVSNVGATNYKPHGGTYTQGVPSTAVETRPVAVNDKYYFDGADWLLLPNTAPTIVVDSALSTSSVNPVQNKVITNALNGKQNTISDLNTIRTGAGKGATALQPGANITELVNNAGYATSADVNTKTFTISSASDLINAQQAYEWTDAGKNAIVVYTPERGIANTGNAGEYSFLYWDSGSPVYVADAVVEESSSQGVGGRSLTKGLLKFVVSNGSVTSITHNHGVVVADFLSTSKTNHPFYPANNYDPATKRYVDEAIDDAVPSKEVPTDPQDFAYFVDDLYAYYTVNGVPYPIIVKDGKVYVFSRVDTEGTEETIVYLQTEVDNEKYMFGKQIDAIPEYKLVYNSGVFDHDVSNLSWFLLGEIKNGLPYWPIVSTESQQDIETKLGYVVNYFNTCSINSNAVIIYDGNVYMKTGTYSTDGNYRKIGFIKLTPQTSNYTTGTSRTTRAVINIYCTYDSVTGTYTYDHYTTNTSYSESPYVLRTDYDYPTPYTPAYDGSPATKKYVDDNTAAVSGLTTTQPSNPSEGAVYYDSTNDVVKAYDGTNWNIIGDDTANINTKTFYLSDTTDLTTAQEVMDWLLAGKNPIVKYSGYSYLCVAFDSQTSLLLVSTYYDVAVENNSVSKIKAREIYFSLNSNNEVTAITAGDYRAARCLSTDIDYPTPYTPQYDGSPATKKYVDDIVGDIESLLANI